MTDQNDFPILSPVEIRVLGCLAEKKALTPDIYPLTLNAAHAAANQKTARDPVMALELADVRRALGTLEHKGLVRQLFASRVERYEHLLAQRFSLTSAQIALIGLMMLRGPQTAHELLARGADGAVPVGRGRAERSRSPDRTQAAARPADRARPRPARGTLRPTARRAGSGSRASDRAGSGATPGARTSKSGSRPWSDRWRC